MKLLIFLPLILMMIPFFLLVIGFFYLVFRLVVKAKNDEWIGSVTDKVHNTRRGEHNRIEHFYSLVVKTDEGKERKIGMSAEMFSQYSVGDRIAKDKGSLYPRKA